LAFSLTDGTKEKIGLGNLGVRNHGP
jgi:hypothetical protein